MRCDEVTESLTAWIDGELTPEESMAVESHLAECAACTRRRDELAGIGLLFDAWRVEDAGVDLWPALEREAVPAAEAGAVLGAVLDGMRALQAEVHALRSEVADLRRQLALRPAATRPLGALLPDVSGRQTVRPLI